MRDPLASALAHVPVLTQCHQQLADGCVQAAGRVIGVRTDDPVVVGMRIGTGIAAAVYGPRGEFREQRQLPEAGRD